MIWIKHGVRSDLTTPPSFSASVVNTVFRDILQGTLKLRFRGPVSVLFILPECQQLPW